MRCAEGFSIISDLHKIASEKIASLEASFSSRNNVNAGGSSSSPSDGDLPNVSVPSRPNSSDNSCDDSSLSVASLFDDAVGGDGSTVGSFDADERDDDEPPLPAPAIPDFSKLTAKTLKEECKKRGIKLSGSKKDLVKRLLDKETNLPAGKISGPNTSDNDSSDDDDDDVVPDFSKLNLLQLKAKCRKRGIHISGSKKIVVKRLLD
jgi:hypothetical protein